MVKSWRQVSRTTLIAIALPALVIAIGLQTTRVLFPSVAWYLRDTMGAGPLTLAGYALGTFLLGFLAAVVRRLLGPRASLWLTAGGLAIVRMIEQVVVQPLTDLWLSMAGVALFLLFLPIFVGHARELGGKFAGVRIAYGLFLGLALDSAIHGATQTLDLSWIAGLPAFAWVTFMALLVVWLLTIEPVPAPRGRSEVFWSQALPLLGLGPFLLVQALIFQNQGWLSEVGQVSPQAGFLLVMLGNLLAVAAMTWSLERPSSFHLLPALAVAILLVAAAYNSDRPSASFLPIVLISQTAMGWAWGLLATLTASPSRPGLSRTTFSVAFGMLLFVLLAFVYYISLDISIPLPRRLVPAIAAGIFALLLLLAAVRIRRQTVSPVGDITAALLALGLLLVPLVSWALLGPAPQARSVPGEALRVMTYNLHSAYNTDGRQDPEAIARVIESSGADIVALQEISRGWLINGSTDLVAWLSRRLDMPAIFDGTTGPMWGNALLSRYPILEHGDGDLPLAGSILPRGYLWAKLEVGQAEPLFVIATHLHHVEAQNEVRLKQVPVVLDFWGRASHSIILGDLNSEPGYPEIELFLRAGLVDSWGEAGQGEGLTWPADGPFERIDWIWHTPDLRAESALVIESTASDHLAVLASIARATQP